MPLLVWTALPDGKVDYFNKRREEIYEQAEKDGYWNLRNFVHPDDMFEILKTRTHKVEPGVDFQVENRFKMKDGSYRWHLSQGKAIRDEKGALVRWIGTATDIHDLKMAEQESKRRNELLEHANRELESFSYSVSHDLRAPLRAINGYATMLMKTAGYKFDEEEKRKFDLIVSNATKMNKLIDDLLAFSRVSRAELHRNRIDMNKVAQAAWEQQLILNPDINVDFKMHSLPDTFGDESLMLQVFHNFLSNAVKFTRRRKEPVIEVGGKSNRSEEIYYVKDNGAGFNMNYRHKLFGVFQRLHSESEYEGTGVGLAIVQRIIHRHGGRVWAEGKVGKGATFYFSLPNNR